MRNRLVSSLLALALAGSASAQQPAPPPKIDVSKLKYQESDAVIPAPRPEPVVPPSAAKSIAQQLNDAYVAVFERVAPTVVVIDVTKRPSVEGESSDYFPDFFFHNGPDGNGPAPETPGGRRPARPQSEGSGFIIQSGGYILTNNHVVAGAEKINVRLKDRRQFTARLVGTDDKTDIAVIKIDATELPAAELADSEGVRVGEIACAIGVPYNLDYSFTAGVVSAKGRNNLDLGTTDNYEDFIQTDASINPGNSGGPLVNLDGKVIGMNTLINGLNRGLGFAIPSNMLREVGEQLITRGHVVRPYIGVRIIALDSEEAEKYGAYFSAAKTGVVVISIVADSPAFRSDLRQADIITEVDGVPVVTNRDLQNLVRLKRIGAGVQLTVQRRGRTLKMSVATAELPAEGTRPPGGSPAEAPPVPDAPPLKAEGPVLYGMGMQSVTRDLAARLHLPAAAGVVLVSVEENSPAARADLHPRDVITEVDYEPVKDVAALREAMKKGDPARGIACYIERPEGKTFALIKTN